MAAKAGAPLELLGGGSRRHGHRHREGRGVGAGEAPVRPREEVDVRVGVGEAAGGNAHGNVVSAVCDAVVHHGDLAALVNLDLEVVRQGVVPVLGNVIPPHQHVAGARGVGHILDFDFAALAGVKVSEDARDAMAVVMTGDSGRVGAVRAPDGDVPVGTDVDAAHLHSAELDGIRQELLCAGVVPGAHAREAVSLPLVKAVQDAGDAVVPGGEGGILALGGVVGVALALKHRLHAVGGRGLGSGGSLVLTVAEQTLRLPKRVRLREQVAPGERAPWGEEHGRGSLRVGEVFDDHDGPARGRHRGLHRGRH
mmetsp:Transcript_33059/g.72079  ORF Transcript_33059/g.72079 Transcript_33059/m.72079 type:complete len:310 (+) Transcript_33059:1565-2494(+)